MSFSSAAALMVSLAVATPAALLRYENTEKSKRIDAFQRCAVVSTIVCTVAAVHYMYMRNIAASGGNVFPVRYSDWFVTVPLMLYEFCTLFGIGWGKTAIIMLISVLMLVAGYSGAKNPAGKPANFLVGSFLLGVILWLCYGDAMSPDKEQEGEITAADRRIASGFLLVWVLYGFAYFVSQPLQDLSYNILDIISKGVFGLWVVSVLVEH